MNGWWVPVVAILALVVLPLVAVNVRARSVRRSWRPHSRPPRDP